METRFWKKDIETMPRDDIRKMQDKRLVSMLEYVRARSSFYNNKFLQHGIDVEKVTGLRDLEELPFTERDEIFVDQEEHGQLGTLMCTEFTEPGQTIGLTGARFSVTGKPLRVIISPWDAATQGKLAARGLASCGISPMDYFYIAYHPQFNLLYMHIGLGSINLGSKSVLVGTERAERNARIYMQFYPPSSFFITPSYSRFVAPLIRILDRKYPIRTVIGTGEPGFSLPNVRLAHERLWQEVSTEGEVKVCDAYGLGELGLLGFECRHQNGLHCFEDAYIYEVIDPGSGRRLGPGEEGELVITHLEREAMPLIRYRTGDVTRWDNSPCTCGRTHTRLLGIKGRLDQKLSVAGRQLYYSEIEDSLAGTDGYDGDYNIPINGSFGLDRLVVNLDARKAGPEVCAAIETQLGRTFEIPITARPVDHRELCIYPHKSHRIIDSDRAELFAKDMMEQVKVEG